MAILYGLSVLFIYSEVSRLEGLPLGSHFLRQHSLEEESTTFLLDEEYVQQIQEMERLLQQNYPQKDVRSCRRRRDGTYHVDSICPEQASSIISTGSILYYNPIEKPRIICGEKLDAKESKFLTRACLEPPKFHKVIPDIHGTNMPPIVLRFDDAQRTQPAKDFPCDVPCQSAGQFHIVATRSVDGTDWVFQFSMEGPQYYTKLVINTTAYKDGNFYATTSFKSEVPLPYFSYAEYNISTPGLDYDEAIPGAVFLARNCHSRNNRENIVKQLQESVFRVDSLSGCLHNAETPPGINLADKNDVLRHYLFYLAFENQNEDDYITEKLWGPLQAGTVPIYYGAPNVKEHVPNHSIIQVDDFESITKLAEYLQEVANSKTLYQEYQKWRSEPLPPHFRRKYDISRTHGTCRMCRWAYARMYGLGWEHETQTVQNVSRGVCVNDQGRMVQPVSEIWSTDGSIVSQCHELLDDPNTPHLLQLDRIRRRLYVHDGVLDMTIETTDTGNVDDQGLSFTTHLDPAKLVSQRVQLGHWRVQDDRMRYTFLLWPRSWPLDVDHDGTVRVTWPSAQLISRLLLPTLRLRIIVEPIDTFHEGADREENYFGSVAINDFFHPVEAFIVV